MALRLIRAWREIVPHWNGNDLLPKGEQIRLRYRTLTVEDVFRAQEEIGINLMAVQDLSVQDLETQAKYWRFMRHVLAKYTSEWSGVEADGAALSDGGAVADNIGMGAMDLMGEVVNQIVSESMGTEAEAKNSAGQSVPESSGSGTTAESASPLDSSELATAAAAG